MNDETKAKMEEIKKLEEQWIKLICDVMGWKNDECEIDCNTDETLTRIDEEWSLDEYKKVLEEYIKEVQENPEDFKQMLKEFGYE